MAADPWLLEFANWVTEEEEADLVADAFIKSHLQRVSVGKLQQLSSIILRHLRRRVKCSFCQGHSHTVCRSKSPLVSPKAR